MGNKLKNERPRGLRPVKRIELSEKNVKQRWILIVVFLLIAVGALGYGLHALLSTEPGWVEIEAVSENMHCGEDFIFSYCLGRGEMASANEKRLVTALYSEAAVNAYRWFDRYQSFDGVVNLQYINTHPNEVLTVDPVLYQAFAKVLADGNRRLYLGALCEEYEVLFFGFEHYAAAEDSDPYRNEEFRETCRQMAAYAADPEAITLELLGENRVRLSISEEYAAFGAANGVSAYIDFFRMKNAFVIDYIADVMLQNGLTHGCISSYDGYVRNLDTSGTEYTIHLFDLQGVNVYNVGSLYYQQPMAIVSLRSYAMGEKDATFFFPMSDGRTVTPYIDPADGMYRTSTDSLISVSGTMGCADVLLKMLPIYVSDEWSVEALNALSDAGVHSIWFGENTLYYNDAGLRFSDLYSGEDVSYQAVFVAP